MWFWECQQKMVGATHGEDAFELVQNLFRFHVMEHVFEGQKYVSVFASGGPSVPSLPDGNWV